MKSILKTLFVFTAFAGLVSCEDEQDLKFASPEGEFAILSPTSGESVVLSPLTPNNPGLSLTWEPMSYGTPTQVNYTVQVAQTGTEFENPIDVVTTPNTYVTINSESLNGAAIAAGLESDVEGALDVRIRASVGSELSGVAYSDSIIYLVTPYVTYPFRDLFLVGEATAAGWDPGSNNYALFRDPENGNVFSYTGRFTAGGFKVIENRGQWAPQYGAGAGNTVQPRPTEGDPDPTPFNIPSEGYYTFTINLDDMTYSLDPYDESAAPSYSTIAIIGSATPNQWDSPDTDMTQSDFDPHIWYISNQFLTAGGELKFRANDDWGINWGGGTSYSGTATQDGPNIPIGIPVSANYDIWFNDLTGQYIYVPAE